VFDFSEAAKTFLIEKGYDVKYGARPLRRAIERHLEDSLAEAILGGEIKAGEVIQVDVQDDQLSFEQGQQVSGAAGA
jgi:ATP-dependent Clp protease ATP-binding subunit ClpC